MNSPNKQIKCSGCTCVCVCVLEAVVSVLIRAVLCIEALTSCSSELMYSTDAVSWNETIPLNRCACFFPSQTVLFLSVAAIRAGSIDWECSRFMCGLHTHGCYCSCICATCAEYFSSLRLFTALWFPPPRSVSISSESALHSKQCEIDDCVVSGLVWEEQSVWQFMALSRCTRLLFTDQSLNTAFVGMVNQTKYYFILMRKAQCK